MEQPVFNEKYASGMPSDGKDTQLPLTSYNSEMRIRGDTHLISHDPHLNANGEALHRFLLEQAVFPPQFFVSCKGTHQETRTRSNGKGGVETYYVTITDFDFVIDLTRHIIAEPFGAPIFIVGDRDATFRGKTHKEVDEGPTKTPEGKDLEASEIALGKQFRRKATGEEKDRSEERKNHLEGAGLPPWVHLPGEPVGTQAGVDKDEARRRFQYGVHGPDQTFDDSGVQPPLQDLRQWAEEYCESRKMLKEFNFEKIVHGWNFLELQGEIAKTLRANWAHPKNDPHIKFHASSEIISVRPDNWLSRMLSRRLVKFFLWIFLIYPLFIWPYKRWGRGGGGEWRVAGAAYSIAKWVHLEDSYPGERVEEYRQRTPVLPSLRYLRATPKGISRLEGMLENEWFHAWQETIATFARTKRDNTTPVETPLAAGSM
ncbi:hypothetical protein FRB94_009797 [Tulasnella sp. JGI-2019a]|nr:hypothetical protein FRB94_009797 [Tulasnella sp. JGI-2019a]